jgi:hypothetical protein
VAISYRQLTELQIIFRLSLYRLGLNLTENMCHVSECVFIGQLPSTEHGADHVENTTYVRMLVYWPVTQHWKWRGPHRKHLFWCQNACLLASCPALCMALTTWETLLPISFYCSVRVFRALPRNRSTCHNKLSVVFPLLLPTTACITCFNIHNLLFVSINSDYFPKENSSTGVYTTDIICFIWCKLGEFLKIL